jgi:UDP-N-acetylglucosamine 2-epimerase (non-hydrolysing)
MKTYLACMGTRPEIIKMAAVHRVIKERGDRVVVLHTGQHEAIAHVLYKFFDMGPDLKRRSPPTWGSHGNPFRGG